MNHLRSEKRRQGLYDNLLAEQPWRYHVIEEETNRLLLAAIDKLPPRSREVLRHILSGMDLAQIAETMDISVNTVKWMRADALKRLKIKLNI